MSIVHLHFLLVSSRRLGFDISCNGLSEKIYYPVMMEILEAASEYEGEEYETQVKRAVRNRVKDLEIEFEEIPLNIESFASLLKLGKENKIKANVGKKLLRELFEKGERFCLI